MICKHCGEKIDDDYVLIHDEYFCGYCYSMLSADELISDLDLDLRFGKIADDISDILYAERIGK